MTKTCIKCGQQKGSVDFHKDARRSDGLHCYCKQCQNELNRTALRKVGSRRWAKQKLMTGTVRARERGHAAPDGSVEDVLELWIASDGHCALCDATTRLCLDHCHETGELRGFLCEQHNKMLGCAGDSPEVLARAIRYLK